MKCPNCKAEMERKGSWQSGDTDQESSAMYVTLYQCPNCKRVDLDKVD